MNPVRVTLKCETLKRHQIAGKTREQAMMAGENGRAHLVFVVPDASLGQLTEGKTYVVELREVTP